jgi:hypothetical protein
VDHSFELFSVSCFTFPNDENLKAEEFKLAIMFAITRKVALQLGLPIGGVCPGARRESAALMGMPEAAVDKNCPAVGAVGKIGLAGKVRRVLSKS